MQIGIIGAGKIGATVGRLWAKAGHKVQFATRHPDLLKSLVEDIGENASTGTIKEAARFGEVVFVAVPFGHGRNWRRRSAVTSRARSWPTLATSIPLATDTWPRKRSNRVAVASISGDFCRR